MSAVFGIVRFDGRPVLEGEMYSMAEALAPHGGDGRSTSIDGNAGLGHLLRVVTAEDRFERQPGRRPGGHHSLVFSGRLDNRKESLSQLDDLHGSPDISDSAIVSAAFEHWSLA